MKESNKPQATKDDGSVRWMLDETRRLLEMEPPQVFVAVTHIDMAIARVTHAATTDNAGSGAKP